MTHSIDVAVLFALAGLVAFIAAWYLIGVGIGIAQRGYNRVAPYKIQTKVVPPPINRPVPTHTWDWKSRV